MIKEKEFTFKTQKKVPYFKILFFGLLNFQIQAFHLNNL